MDPLDSETNETSKSPVRRKLLSYLGMMLAMYAGICLLLTIFQRGMISLPTNQSHISPASAGLQEELVEPVSFLSGESQVDVQGWLVMSTADQDAEPDSSWATIIFCGNGYHRGGRGDLVTLFNQLGSDVFIFDYQGYGQTGGAPTEQNIIADAKQIWTLVITEYGYEPERVLLFGESLGGGVATQLAEHACEHEQTPAALVVRSTFSSLVDAASNHYGWLPVRWLLLDRYQSKLAIQNVACPILQFHGDRDQIVPAELGQELFNHAPNTSDNQIEKQFILLEGVGHNNVPQTLHSEMGQSLKSFVDRLGL